MLIEHQHPDNKSIMVAVLGAPNVGKSSMINYLTGMDLSIVTRLPQTTRNKFHCVFTIDKTEVILVDTPGLHKSNQEFNKRMNQQAREGVFGADLNLLMIDLSKEVLQQIIDFKENIRNNELGKTWLVFTKTDLISNINSLPLDEVFEKAKEILGEVDRYLYISSKDGDNMHILTGAICDVAAPGPHMYNKNQASNKHTRFFVTEYVREQLFELLKDELPYQIAVTIDEYVDLRKEKNKIEGVHSTIVAQIAASIHVNRPSQRAIVIGSGGSMIKKVGMAAREKIENLVGGQINLNLHVKVSPKWFKNNFILEEIGLPRAIDSNRVWRQK